MLVLKLKTCFPIDPLQHCRGLGKKSELKIEKRQTFHRCEIR